jgi:transposase
MIGLPSGVRVLIATRPVDFRKGMDGLAALVKEHLGADPFSGTIFVFRAKRGDFTSFSIPFAICRGGVSLASASR